MPELYNDFSQIWRLCKILKHIDDPYWITPNQLYQYPKGFKEFLQKDIHERLENWRKENPTGLLNGVN